MASRRWRGPRRGARRGPWRQPSWRRWTLLLAALGLASVAVWAALAWSRPPRRPVVGPHPRHEAPASSRRSSPGRRAAKKKSSSMQAPAGELALVIDDLGRSLDEVAALDRLGVPISYSVLPFEVSTRAVVARLAAEHKEILCHLPMQPANLHDPGPGALNAAMDLDSLAAATEKALAQVPGAVGANNHMGSELTADRSAMGTVLDVLQRHSLFFLDSRTSKESVGYQLARSLGLPAAQRDVFLDDDPDPAAIRAQLARLLALSRERGAAVAIGHPRPSTLEVLREEVPRAKAEGFTFVPVSFLVDRTGEPL